MSDGIQTERLLIVSCARRNSDYDSGACDTNRPESPLRVFSPLGSWIHTESRVSS